MTSLTRSEQHELHPATAWWLVRAILRLAKLRAAARQEMLRLEAIRATSSQPRS